MSTRPNETKRTPWGRFLRGRSTEPSRAKTAFVLSGGGIQGSIQIGMLRALIERGIRPDVIAGTSVGALNGVILAQRPDEKGVEHLSEIWHALEGEDIFPGNFLSRIVKLIRSNHVFPRTGVERIVDGNVSAINFEDLPIEMTVVACDLDTGEEVRFSTGAIRPALFASTALPGIFPPVSHDGRRLVDGGVVNNVPVNAVDRPDISSIYVLNVSSELDEEKDVKHPLDVLLQAFSIAKGQRWLFDLDRYSTDPRVHVLPRPPFDAIAFDDLSHTRRLEEESYDLTRSYLGSVAA